MQRGGYALRAVQSQEKVLGAITCAGKALKQRLLRIILIKHGNGAYAGYKQRGAHGVKTGVIVHGVFKSGELSGEHSYAGYGALDLRRGEKIQH